ncbi:MAG: PIG-L family deacetylase [Anaerolineae bacterium]|nr:PIG-L family deacetylase [Anaerolineae bacterium]
MKFLNPDAQVYIPDGSELCTALRRTTHLGIGAHHDDLEIMAIHGILACYHQPGMWFSGIIVTDGAGSPRGGSYADVTDDEMKLIRIVEQNKAARIGDYAAQVMLQYPSIAVKDSRHHHLDRDLTSILSETQPDVIYTHNLADKYPTHVAVGVRVVKALRSLPKSHQPDKLYGCEVWRGLDWMRDEDKVALDCSANQDLQSDLLRVFDSQISDGKRYDLAAVGRSTANATYYASHDVDNVERLIFAMDLAPLIRQPALDIQSYIAAYIKSFSEDECHLLSSIL